MYPLLVESHYLVSFPSALTESVPPHLSLRFPLVTGRSLPGRVCAMAVGGRSVCAMADVGGPWQDLAHFALWHVVGVQRAGGRELLYKSAAPGKLSEVKTIRTICVCPLALE